jgi:PAS domain S-box-containing protein
LTANPAAQELLGYPPEELIGRLFLDLVLDKDRQRASLLFQVVSSSDQKSTIECQMVCKNSDIKDMLISMNWSAADHSYFCVIHDVTEYRQMQRLKRQFVAMITHDLRSPLGSVLGTLALIAKQYYSMDSEQGSTRVVEAIQSVDRMLVLISELLECSKFEAASLKLNLEKVNVSSIIQESIGSVRGYADQQNITLSSETTDDAWINVDRPQLVRVLVNLLANAIKFSAVGSGVEIRSSKELTSVRIEVLDRGRGISLEDQQTIFEPYKQVGQSANNLKGTGLGLTICKSIIEAHGGIIGVESAVQRGSIFWIVIPIT